MSKSRSSSIVSVLKLLTPELVEKHSEGAVSVELPIKMAAGAEEFSESERFLSNNNQAKIIPFKRSFNNDDNPEHSEEEKKSASDPDEDSSSSEFLIEERLKSRESRRKLLEGEAKKLYLAGANLEFCEPSDDGEESKALDPKGVLFNKKHP